MEILSKTYTTCWWSLKMLLEMFCWIILANSVKSEVNIKIGLIMDGETSTTRKTNDGVMTVRHNLNIREPYQIFKAVHDLGVQDNVDVIILFDRDWSGSTPINTNKTFIVWDRRPSFAIQRHGTLSQPEDIECATCENLPSRNTRSATARKREKRSTSAPYCIYDLESMGDAGTTEDTDIPVITGPAALTSLIVRQLKWKSVFILHESATEREVTNLVDMLSKKNVLFVIYNIDTVQNLHSVLHNIYNAMILAESEINFVVLCRSNCVTNVLNTANTFDCKNSKQKTLLKMFSRWLVAVYDHTLDVSRALETSCGDDLDNVALVALPEFNEESSVVVTTYSRVTFKAKMKEFEKALHNGVVEHKAQTAGERTNASLNEFLTDFIKDKATQWHPVHKCRGYKIDTLLWTASGRDFSTVGYVKNNGDVTVRSDLFPNTRYGYNKRKFLVSTLHYDPFVIKRYENDTAIYEGMCMDLLKELARTLNFTYELTEPPDKKWGSFDKNLTFNGMIGQLQREEVDMVAADISIQKEREMVMDFAFPFYYGDTSVIIKKPDPNAKKWRTLIDPFKWEVLIAIISVLPVVSFLVFLMEKYNPYYTNQVDTTPLAEENRLGTYIDSFWYMYGALLSQGGVHLPDSITGRTFVSCWWLFCIIIVGTYCGNLIAFLTVTKAKAPFDTLEEMVAMKNEYKWGLQAGTHWEFVFTTSTNPAFRAVGDLMIEFNRSDPSIMSVDVQEHLARVRKGGYGWIGDTVIIEVQLATNCDLMMMKEKFLPLKYAFGFPNNSPHTKIFSEQMILIHESGLLQVWKRRWWPKSNMCKSGLVTEAKAISIIDVQSAFYVAGGGAVLGFLAFLTEIVVAKIRQYRKKSRSV